MNDLINVALGVLVAISVLVVIFSVREFFYLRHLARVAPLTEDLWLLRAIRITSGYLTFTAVYFISLTVVGAISGPVTVAFPEVRVLNGVILLGVLYLPVYLGRQMRKRRQGPRASLLDSLRGK